jgi:hypothetical protein
LLLLQNLHHQHYLDRLFLPDHKNAQAHWGLHSSHRHRPNRLMMRLERHRYRRQLMKKNLKRKQRPKILPRRRRQL